MRNTPSICAQCAHHSVMIDIFGRHSSLARVQLCLVVSQTSNHSIPRTASPRMASYSIGDTESAEGSTGVEDACNLWCDAVRPRLSRFHLCQRRLCLGQPERHSHRAVQINICTRIEERRDATSTRINVQCTPPRSVWCVPGDLASAPAVD